MKISVETYVELRKAELNQFAEDWRTCMENDPVSYDFDEATVDEWREQEEAAMALRDL